jgi:hypothetical protein
MKPEDDLKPTEDADVDYPDPWNVYLRRLKGYP